MPQAALPDGCAYEAHIHATGAVPTRDNLHDFFNALVWLHFPTAKRLLNRLQAAAIARDGVQASRGPVRDAATLFDENAVLFLSAEPALSPPCAAGARCSSRRALLGMTAARCCLSAMPCWRSWCGP